MYCHLIHQVIKFHRGVHGTVRPFLYFSTYLLPPTLLMHCMTDRQTVAPFQCQRLPVDLLQLFRPHYLLIAFRWFVSIGRGICWFKRRGKNQKKRRKKKTAWTRTRTLKTGNYHRWNLPEMGKVSQNIANKPQTNWMEQKKKKNSTLIEWKAKLCAPLRLWREINNNKTQRRLSVYQSI